MICEGDGSGDSFGEYADSAARGKEDGKVQDMTYLTLDSMRKQV